MRSKIFDDAELERLRREAIPSSNESAMAGDAAPHSTDQHPHVEAAMDLPVVVDSNDDEIVSHELEQMRSILEEAILETRSTPLENRPRLPRIPLSKRNRAVVRALNPMLVTYLEASRAFARRTRFSLAPQWQFAVLLAPNFPWLDALLHKVTPSQPEGKESRTVSQRQGPLSAD
ncbi:unnamed protein product [Parnassius apollo]|uniref:(apollo) hypothetical protein n=1 Tax=Parnassius apollo TaxID=110799 RepID=A0A8S3WJR7_PARAO|nr:unnamed protein product [Parnassius apollo]